MVIIFLEKRTFFILKFFPKLSIYLKTLIRIYFEIHVLNLDTILLEGMSIFH